MRVWHDKEAENRFAAGVPRSHPWTVSDHDEAHRYVDFRRQPDLIEAACADFTLWNTWEEVQEFFGLLRWLNSDGGPFETNDCAFEGPIADNNKTPEEFRRKKLVSEGRVMLFFQRQALNAGKCITWLLGAFEHYITQFDAPDAVVVGLCLAPTRFVDLPDQPLGHELVIQWWTWGDDVDEIRRGLGSVVSAIRQACENIAIEMAETSG